MGGAQVAQPVQTRLVPSLLEPRPAGAGQSGIERAEPERAEPERAGPERAEPDRLETARRRLFAPGAAAEDRDRWQTLVREQERDDPPPDRDPSATAPVQGRVPPAPRDVPPQAAPSRRRRNLIAAATVAILVALGIAASTVRPPDAGPLTVPVSSGPAAPALAGITLLTMTDAAGTSVDPGPTVVWNSGWDVVHADGAALALALRCRGAGRVEVLLTSGERFAFTCTAVSRTFVRASAAAHPGRLTVLVPTTGAVVWSLRLVARPLPSTSRR